MEPLEAHSVKELLWNLGHTRVVVVGAAWGQGCLHRAAGVVTALAQEHKLLWDPWYSQAQAWQKREQGPLGLEQQLLPSVPGLDTVSHWSHCPVFLEKGESSSSCNAVASSGTFQGIPQCWSGIPNTICYFQLKPWLCMAEKHSFLGSVT